MNDTSRRLGELVLRIHFTGADLGRVRLAAAPDIMWEIVCGIQLLQNREGQLVFDDWRRQVRATARRTSAEGAIRTFAALCPHAEYFPDFLTPATPNGEVETSIETVLSTPRRQLRNEMSQLASYRRLPRWAAELAVGDPGTLRKIGTVIHRFHNLAIKPYESLIRIRLRSEFFGQAELITHGGTEALLTNMSPLMNWASPVLTVRYPFDQDLHLDGRGLWLIPSFFCWRYPITLADPALTPVLVYPVDHHPGWLRTGQDGTGLAALIGSTRAAVLEAMIDECTTTQAARSAGISPATASHHATVLRDAQLITSRRDANTVVHIITALGMELLSGDVR